MSRPPAAAALDQIQSPQYEARSSWLADKFYTQEAPSFSNERTVSTPVPTALDFTPCIYPSECTNPTDQLPPATPEQLKSAFDNATAITFTSAADNQQNAQQPDYFLGTDGVLRANPNKTSPNADGSINIEIQAKNKYDTDAKKFADQLQKATIKDLIQYFSQNNPRAKIPQYWLDQLSKEPDLPPPPVPISTAPPPTTDLPPQPQVQPQPQEQQTPTQNSSPAGADSGVSYHSTGSSGGGGGGGNYYNGGGSEGRSGSGGGGSGSTHIDNSNASSGASNDKLSNIRTIVEVAKEKGIDPALAVATSLIETGGTFDNKIVGDNGHSIGLFQLNDKGEGYNVPLATKEDPRQNAEIALGVMSQYLNNATDFNADGTISGGEIAASAQRPADQAGYAQKVDAAIPQAQALIAEAEKAPKISDMPVGAWGGYSNGHVPTSALENVHGFKVAPGVADNLNALLDAAQQAGVWNPNEPYATGTYRTLDQQVALYAKQGPDWAATPGKSMHGWGEAIDFTMNNPQLISWLKDNAEKYGFKNHTKEPWHYSTNGS